MYQPRGEEAPGLRKKEGVGEANSLLAASVDAEGGDVLRIYLTWLGVIAVRNCLS